MNNINDINEVAAEYGVLIGCVVEVNVGQDRYDLAVFLLSFHVLYVLAMLKICVQVICTCIAQQSTQFVDMMYVIYRQVWS